MGTLPFSFPVWLFVNEEKHPEDGYPFYLLTVGGNSTPIPTTLPLFTTEEKARHFAARRPLGYPFTLTKIDADIFCELLHGCRQFEDVGVDIGTPDAVIHRVEQLLPIIGSDS